MLQSYCYLSSPKDDKNRLKAIINKANNCALGESNNNLVVL